MGGIWNSLRIVSGLMNSRDWSWLILTFSRDVEERYETHTTHTWTNTERIRDATFQVQNFKLLRYIFLPLEGTIQSCCSLYNESLYCQCRVAFHRTRKPHVAAECLCSVLDATLDAVQQQKAHCEINLSYLLTEGVADGWLDKLLRIFLIAEPWTDRQFGS